MAYQFQPLFLQNAYKIIFIISKIQNFRIESFKVLCYPQTWKFQECSIFNAKAINIYIHMTTFYWPSDLDILVVKTSC